jgi:hypothetical protein
MKPVLFCILLLSAACSGDSKVDTTTPTGTGTTDTTDVTDTSETEGSTTDGDTEGAVTPDAPAATGSRQVLPADWSEKEVKKYMKGVSKGLGVQCDHCHDMSDFTSDSNPTKLKARKMMEMARMIDKDHFGGKGRVTCNTCHKGKLEP